MTGLGRCRTREDGGSVVAQAVARFAVGAAVSRMPRDAMQPGPDDPLVRFPFRFRDALSHRSVKARYVAELHVIAARYREWEVTGTPELRGPIGAAFTPWR
jgi:hypothetical protein